MVGYLLQHENVWDYPRPPRVEPVHARIEVEADGHLVAACDQALRVLETSHPPTVYLPWEAFPEGLLVPSSTRSTWCEFKGRASYLDIVLPGTRRTAAGWTYAAPVAPYEALARHVAIYPSRVDACRIDGVPVQAQAGDFYGGWITPNIEGPFKGGPGTMGW